MNPPDPVWEEQLAKREPPYKSHGEAQIGRLLDRYGLPFFYEQPLIILNRGRHQIWHPDFTLPDCHGLLIEYVGMPDRMDYLAVIRHKKQIYQAHEIPAMFVYPSDLKGPSWPERLYERMEKTRPPITYKSLYHW